MRNRLTRREVAAIVEALAQVLAGEQEEEDDTEARESALQKLSARLAALLETPL